MQEEKLRILEMIKDGTISPEEGLELIGALESSERGLIKISDTPSSDEFSNETTEDEEQARPGRKPRFLYIKVDDEESGKKVNIKIPIALAKFAGKFIPKHAHAEMKAHGVDLDINGILEQLEKDGLQDLVEITESDKKIVKIYTK